MTIRSEVLDDLGWPIAVEAWASYARTFRGEAVIRNVVPFTQQVEAEHRSIMVGEARLLEERAEPMPFAGVTDIRDQLTRADKGIVLEGEELIAIGKMVSGVAKLKKHLHKRQGLAPQLALIIEDLDDFLPLAHSLLDVFGDDGELADHASPLLGQLRGDLRRLKARVEERSQELVSNEEFSESLQDKFWTLRDNRYVLPIRASDKTKIKGIIHGTSQSGQTVFIEPAEMVGLNNKLRLAECELRDEERRIYASLSVLVKESAEEIEQADKVVCQLDLVGAAARMADTLNAQPVVFSKEHVVDLKRARHPLMILNGKACVANDIALGPYSVLLISGPNAGGKTVAMKVLGLSTLMAQAGLHLAVDEHSSLPWFEQVMTSIGDAQSIENELSTFSAHLLSLRTILEGVTPKSLVLIDELCSATSPVQGAAIAQAFLECFIAKGGFAMVTTHYESLKALGANDSHFENASVGFDMETMAPTYKLHIGTPGASAALELASLLDLPKSLLERAGELLGEDNTSVEKLLADIASQREALELATEALASAEEDAQRTKKKAVETIQKAEERVRKEHRNAHGNAIETLLSARKDLERIKDEVKRRRHIDLRGHEKNVDKAARTIREKSPQDSSKHDPLPHSEIKVGAQVFVKALGGVAEIIELRQGGNAVVRRGMLKSVVPYSEVFRASSSPMSGRAQKSKKSKSWGHAESLAMVQPKLEAPYRTADITLDVRGERLDAALAALDKFLDQSILAARDAVFVIHGHGTGALRKGLRESLAHHPAIDTSRPGDEGEGGDGVTVIWLR